MARTSIEESALKFLRIIASEMGVLETMTFGQAIRLWNVTQDLGFDVGSKNQILNWSLCAPEHAEKWFEGLLEYKFIEKISEDKFSIAGNKKHIKSIKNYKKSATKAGKIRAKTGKRDEKGRLKKDPAEIQRPSSGDPADVQRLHQRDPALYNTNLLSTNLISTNLDSTILVSSEYTPLAHRWLEFAFSMTPNGKFKVETFEKAIKSTCKQAGLTVEELTAIFEFIQSDEEFWRDKAVSPAGLLNPSKNGCRKIDNIVRAYQRKPGAKMDAIIAWAHEQDRLKSTPSSEESA